MVDFTPSPLFSTERLSRLHRALDDINNDVVHLTALPDTGLAHDHVWISRETGPDWVARLPKQSQMQLDPETNLDYQAACFRRAAQSGHTPDLHGILPISADFPRGGLLVSAIEGRSAQLPDDLPAIGEALAHLHAITVPPVDERLPLASPRSPWTAMRDEVLEQAGYLDKAPISDSARRRIDTELSLFDDDHELAKRVDSQRCLISFDAHPGNFLITSEGKAVLVDLEKCRYGHPGLDLAHASLYTSTTWDPASHAVLDTATVVDFYRHWWASRYTTDDVMDVEALVATRRAMWLWSTTWCAKWLSLHHQERDSLAQGEDWSAALSEDRLIAHVEDRARHYLSASVIKRVGDDNHRLAHELALT
ncbi:aminoglycoside phosphotransferase family protein [Chromohalobacter sp. 48-RD10]|uniref:aminoglycoside phosphotransferase family protein n=1 Tax=Chromohalobacter sp. 48-RD10 TaxID=2994063 RepID=UPI0024696C13|nr:aminoglycoside phosphotransferase family protein [Chromohalobacter sp. 48-RD10]